MKVNNLEKVLEECELTELPKRNDRAVFHRAIGLIETTAISESYCILKMLDGVPTVKKIYVGGMFSSILAVYPFDFTGVNPVLVDVVKDHKVDAPEVDLNDPNIVHPEVMVPIVHESIIPTKVEADKKAEGAEYGGEWGIVTVTNPEQAKAWLRASAKNGHPEFFGKANIRDEQKLKEEFLKIVAEMKSIE